MNKLIILFITILAISCGNKPFKIGIQPFGEVDKEILDSVQNILLRAYNVDVVLLDNIKLPESAFVNIKSPRYRADSLLIYLANERPRDVDYLLGITLKDISTTKRDDDGNIKSPIAKYTDWGIFGLGYMPGNSCVISTHRLNTAKKELFISRIQKISVHEVGHNLGLEHCETKNCVMQDAVESIQTVDEEGHALCEKFLRKI